MRCCQTSTANDSSGLHDHSRVYASALNHLTNASRWDCSVTSRLIIVLLPDRKATIGQTPSAGASVFSQVENITLFSHQLPSFVTPALLTRLRIIPSASWSHHHPVEALLYPFPYSPVLQNLTSTVFLHLLQHRKMQLLKRSWSRSIRPMLA